MITSRTMGIPVRLGRDFAPQDLADAPAVGLVNESFVQEYFPNANPIGARIGVGQEGIRAAG